MNLEGMALVEMALTLTRAKSMLAHENVSSYIPEYVLHSNKNTRVYIFQTYSD